MLDEIPTKSRTGVCRILRAAERECRCAGRPCGAEFHRDAGQDRVETISDEKEARSLAGSGLARNLFAALRNGYFYQHSLRASGAAGTHSGCDYLHRLLSSRTDHRLFGHAVNETLSVEDEKYQQAGDDNRHRANNEHYIIARPTF